MTATSRRISTDLRRLADADLAKRSGRFFKTGKGEYGAGDRFLGITLPMIRSVVRTYRDTPIESALSLIQSPWHEERMCGLLMLVSQYERGGEKERQKIYAAYMRNAPRVNNWDLVDATAHKIAGRHLLNRSRAPLYTFAASRNLWKNRIAIVSTFAFIDRGELDDAYALSEKLMSHPHDLIHKAVGWVLREAGKKDKRRLERFLERHAKRMPRTMLRYAIEKFPKQEQKEYLRKT